MIQIHQINFKLKKKKRIGRGGKRGTYSGRGIKGQKSRAGRKIKPALREIILKFPKLRGSGNLKIKKKRLILEVNLDKINKAFNNDEKVNIETLISKNVIKIPKSLKKFSIKILAKGDLTKKLIFDKNFLMSRKAKEKIINSGSIIQ